MRSKPAVLYCNTRHQRTVAFLTCPQRSKIPQNILSLPFYQKQVSVNEARWITNEALWWSQKNCSIGSASRLSLCSTPSEVLWSANCRISNCKQTWKWDWQYQILRQGPQTPHYWPRRLRICMWYGQYMSWYRRLPSRTKNRNQCFSTNKKLLKDKRITLNFPTRGWTI